MSFSSQVKKEICSRKEEKPCDKLAECCGILLFANRFDREGMRIITGNRDFSERVKRLFSDVFGVEPNVRKNDVSGRNVMYIDDAGDAGLIFEAFGLDPNAPTARLNRALVEENCCRDAFLRGAFLSGGSVSEPTGRYHLELVTPHYVFSREMTSLLYDMELEPRVTVRQSKYVLYYKSSETIEDFLVRIGAPVSAMAVMQAKVLKEVRNDVNRQVNCEMANQDKTAAAAGRHIRAIKKLCKNGCIDMLPEQLKAAARARINDPEASLSELASSMNPPISRATLNYRLNRVVEISNNKSRPEVIQ